MKKIVLFILLFIPILVSAQEVPFAVKAKTRYSASGMVGIEKIDSLKFYQARLIQEFNIWKIGMGIDLDFLFDEDHYQLRKVDWNHLDDVLDKIYYIRYAKKGDPLYVHLGGFPGVTMGNGLVMRDYSNMQLYPELRNTGLMISGKPHWPLKPSFEIFSSNVKKNQIMSLAARCQPIADSTLKILKDLEVGISMVVDRDQYGNLKYMVSDADSIDIGSYDSDPISVWGFAYTLPVVKNEKFTLGQYFELAHIAHNGTGVILPGIFAEIKNLKVNLEYRIYGKKFEPAFFDKYYEEERAFQPVDSLAEFISKEDALQSRKASHGWNGSINAYLFNRMKAYFAWQNVFGKDLKNGKSIWLKLWVDTQYKRLESCSLAYSKTNAERMSIARLNEHNAEIKAEATFRVSKKRWYFIAKYQERYKDKNNSGHIDWLKEAKRSVGAGVKYVM